VQQSKPAAPLWVPKYRILESIYQHTSCASLSLGKIKFLAAIEGVVLTPT
jgi:hypothetical protein